jgi:hypothetical protein
MLNSIPAFLKERSIIKRVDSIARVNYNIYNKLTINYTISYK